ncbi:MAG: hypothetical protein LUE99_02250 [Bacteroides sp.]|nr:hypothetical protein [Bacteroides sp.]
MSKFEKLQDLDCIVDEAVKKIIENAVAGKNFKEAIAGKIYMNEAKGILIKKVRCYANSVKRPLSIRQHRDLSQKEYKRQFYVTNGNNYMLVIYEGVAEGKVKRDFELVNMLDAANFYKKSADKLSFPQIVPCQSVHNYPAKYMLKIGTMVMLYDESPDEINFADNGMLTKRLYKVVGLSVNPTSPGYGVISLRYHQEARQAKDIQAKNGLYRIGEVLRPAITLLHTQFNALIEGVDFEITVLGEIKKLR